MASDLATAGDRLSFPGTLGYLDAKYLQFITNIPGPARSTSRSTANPEHAEVDDERHARLTIRQSLGGRLDLNTTYPTAAAASSSKPRFRASTRRVSLSGTRTSYGAHAGNRFTIGLHGKNLADTRYIVSGYNYILQDPYTGHS